MTLSDIHPTSETWTRHTAGMQWFAAYRVDRRQSLEEYNTPWVPVLHHRCEQGAEQQTQLVPCVTREQAAAAAERILKQLGYQIEGAL